MDGDVPEIEGPSVIIFSAIIGTQNKMRGLHLRRRRLSGADVWRTILKWIGPEPPRSGEDDSVLLGVVVLVLLTISLPYLFGMLFGQ